MGDLANELIDRIYAITTMPGADPYEMDDIREMIEEYYRRVGEEYKIQTTRKKGR